MHVSVDHAALQRAVATLAPVFGGTTTYGPTGRIRLDTDRRTLRLTAYGSEAALMLTVPAQIEDSGEAVLPGKLFGAAVEALDRERVALARTSEGLRVDCGASQFVLGVTTVEAPSLEVMLQDAVPLPAHALSLALERVSFAASTERSYGPAALGGVLLEVGESRLRAVATDGAQLALAGRSLASDAHLSLRYIVPVLTATMLARLLRTLPENSEVQLAASRQAVFLQWDGGRVGARPLDGTFPDYQRVLAGQPDATTRIRASRRALLAALKRAGAVVPG
jgi:DNA polymerase-3 subunit beta